MRAFLSEEKSLAIITPYRCGSSYLAEHSFKHNLFVFNLHTEKARDIFKKHLESAENKVFIFRDPVERYLSLYHRFCFEKNPKQDDNGYSYVSKKRSKDFWQEALWSMPRLEKNFNEDFHTITQYSYFTSMGENVSDYDIIDVKDYEKFMFLYLNNKVPRHMVELENVPINYRTILCLERIFTTIKKIYADDYQFLQPNIMDL